jgi:hypothetical protein
MTRQFFWIATALALSFPLHTLHSRAVAQQAGDASAEAEADTGDVSADASADAGAESNDQADAQAESSDSSTQAESDSSASDDTSQADTKIESSDESAKDETRGATNDSQNAQTDSPNANDDQSTQGETPATPPPSTQTDPNANQSREQSRVVEGQQPNQQDADASRERAGNSEQGRTNRGERNRRDRENDFRVGIQFGRATDRGLIINHIDQNSFYYRNGFRRGDLVVSVHGRPVRNDADFMRFFVLEPGQRVPIVVIRDGRRETIYVQYRDIAQNQRGFDNQQYRAGGAYLGVAFDAQVRDAAVVASVNPGSPAQEAGLQSGDILLALNGQEIRSYTDAISTIRGMRPGDELEIIIERARGERQIVAMLDSPPSVRTAGRPDVQLERRTNIQQPIQGQGRYYDDRYEDDRYEDGRLRERDRNYDDGRNSRPLLPRVRN